MEGKIQKKIEAGQDITSDETALASEKSRIDKYDAEIMAQFKATGEKIKGLPAVIKQRQTDFVSKYQENIQILKSDLNAINQASTPAEKKQAHAALNSFLEKTKPPVKRMPLDPNKLPNRTAKPVYKKPRTSPAEFKKDIQQQTAMRRKPVLVASAGPLTGLLDASPSNNTMQLALAAPTSADLAQTDEVQFTPAIVAQAQALGNNPVQIYNWVRNNIEYVPTYGSIQGADMCLQTRQCNDFDTASLLIALLRASNIPAHYVYGTIQLPIGNVENWVGGFTNAESALNLIASGGIPVTGMTTSGGTVSAAQMEHVWVEAYVPYGNYRGLLQDKSIQTWIPMDASYKLFSYKKGIDVKSITGFDPSSFVNGITATSTIDPSTGSITNISSTAIQNQVDTMMNELNNYINTNMPNATVGDVLGSKDIVQENQGILPASLPYQVIVKGETFSQIPDSLRYSIAITIDDPTGINPPLSYSASLPQIASKRLTVGYMPATDADAQTLTAYGFYNAPLYLVNMIPVLYVNGTPTAEGSSMGMGESQNLTVTFYEPGASPDSVTHSITASTYASIGIDPQVIPSSLVSQRSSGLNQTINQLSTEDVSVDDIYGEILNLHSLTYFYQVDAINKMAAQGKIAYVKQPSEMLSSLSPVISYVFDIPYSITNVGMNVDVKRNIITPVSLSGNGQDEITYMQTEGEYASAEEHAIFEELHQNAHGVSAVKIISVANQQGIPIYTINSANSSTILPKLQISAQAMSDIQSALAAGEQVIVPETSIQYYDWHGDGYIITDPNTGAGAYMISGGLAGGGTADLTDTLISELKDFASSAYYDIAAAIAKFKSNPAETFFEGAGTLLSVISGIIAAIDMWAKTGSPWKAAAVGGITIVLSLVVGLFIGEGVIFAAADLATAIVIIIAVDLITTLVEQLIFWAIQYALLLRSRWKYAKRDGWFHCYA